MLRWSPMPTFRNQGAVQERTCPRPLAVRPEIRLAQPDLPSRRDQPVADLTHGPTGRLGDELTTASTSRRCALAALVAVPALGCLAGPSRAENGPLPKTCQFVGGLSDSDSQLPPPLLPYNDPAGRFKLSYPCGWTRVTNLSPDFPVLASFYNPEEPGAETLAVYRAPAPQGVRETGDLGSAQDVAAGLAGVAPNGLAIESYELGHNGRQYIIVHVQFGGNTAGMFGAAREFRAITVSEGVQYTLRVTTTRYRYLAFDLVRELMRGATDSFELLG